MKLLHRLLKVLFLLVATATAQEELHCIVIDVPQNNLMLVREEMALASPPVAGKDPQLFSTNGRPRDVIFRGNVSLAGKQRVELGNGRKGKTSAERASNEPGVTIIVEMLPGRTAPLHRYDFSMLLPSGAGDHQRFQTRGQTLAVKVNCWQEVASWTSGIRSVMLWQYVARKSSEPAEPKRNLKKEWLPDAECQYTVDVLFTVVQQATADQLHTISPEFASLAVDLQNSCVSGQWKYFRLNVQPGVPFTSQSSRVDLKWIDEPGYDDACLATLDGTLTVRDSGVINIAGQLKAPCDLPGENEIKTCSFGGDVALGEWKVHAISDGPMIKWNLQTLPGWTSERPYENGKVNMVAFRVLKVDD
ncbi:MAG: hypothetical protein V4819_05595 [Verrucomicrobiota bacterium]